MQSRDNGRRVPCSPLNPATFAGLQCPSPATNPQAERHGSYALGPVERDYLGRTTGRDAYRRAMEACPAIKTWVAELNAQAAGPRG
jgi:hypothetical protein